MSLNDQMADHLRTESQEVINAFLYIVDNPKTKFDPKTDPEFFDIPTYARIRAFKLYKSAYGRPKKVSKD